MSKRYATLHELSTIYGIKDLYDMVEIIAVDSINDWLENEAHDA